MNIKLMLLMTVLCGTEIQAFDSKRMYSVTEINTDTDTSYNISIKDVDGPCPEVLLNTQDSMLTISRNDFCFRLWLIGQLFVAQEMVRQTKTQRQEADKTVTTTDTYRANGQMFLINRIEELSQENIRVSHNQATKELTVKIQAHAPTSMQLQKLSVVQV